MERFLKIAITPPDVSEADMVRAVLLLESGQIDIVHLRAPGATEEEMARLVELVPAGLRKRVRLHSHFGLIERYRLGGAHLNSRHPEAPGGGGLLARGLSKSCHSIEEVRAAGAEGVYDYVTLSPVFDSISKKGYTGKAELLEAPLLINNVKVIALGGVTPGRLGLLKAKGFAGAAMLGYYFPRQIKS